MTGESRRVFEDDCLLRLTLTGYRIGAEILAEAALTRLGEIAAVIGIAHGGRAPAYAIAARVGAPVVAVTARHGLSDAAYTQVTDHVGCDPAPLRPLMNRPGPFLVVDDICGAGAKLRAVTTALAYIASPEATICTATLCRNAGAPPGMPDLYVWDVADWVVFPWEPTLAADRATPLPTPTEARTP